MSENNGNANNNNGGIDYGALAASGAKAGAMAFAKGAMTAAGAMAIIALAKKFNLMPEVVVLHHTGTGTGTGITGTGK